MMRSLLSTVFIATILAPGAAAQPPDRLDHYHIVPGRSVFLQTGGFAGIEQRYRLRGEYDFLRLWEGGTPDERLRSTARFDNADVRAPLGPMLPAFIDVDHLLNLEGLRGRLLPLGAPFDVYKFEGRINDHGGDTPDEFSSSIDMYAALVGPWMFLYGETTPPVGSADFFEYEIRALARTGRPWADLNEDGAVDASEYAWWREGRGERRDVTFADLRSQYGETPPDMDLLAAMLTSALQSAVATPEPTSIALMFFSACFGVCRRQRS